MYCDSDVTKVALTERTLSLRPAGRHACPNLMAVYMFPEPGAHASKGYGRAWMLGCGQRGTTATCMNCFEVQHACHSLSPRACRFPDDAPRVDVLDACLPDAPNVVFIVRYDVH